MPPELHEYEGDAHRSDTFSAESEYVGAPSEFADEAEAQALVQGLVTAAAGIGLATPFVMVGLLLLSCLMCVVIAWAAGLG
ncbi:MAG: hypothetical protein JXN59_06640 [Anaerolineae bacterium]|nr:hypothetical protein [Anaerolineae bacterium]